MAARPAFAQTSLQVCIDTANAQFQQTLTQTCNVLPLPALQQLCTTTATTVRDAAISVCIMNAGSMGDPHLYTFDRLYFDFQALGDFVAVSNQNDFIVQVRHGPWAPNVAVNVAVALKVGTHRVTILPGEPGLRIDGVPRSLCKLDKSALRDEDAPRAEDGLRGEDGSCTWSFAEGGSIQSVGPGLRIVWPDDLRSVFVEDLGAYLNLRVAVPSSEGLRGLWVGVPDGDPSNDLRTRGGATLPLTLSLQQFYGAFGDSWRVTPGESLFDQPSVDNENPRQLGAAARGDSERAAAESACVDEGVAQPELLEACTLDVSELGLDAAGAFSRLPEGAAFVHLFATEGALGDPSSAGGRTRAADGAGPVDENSRRGCNVGGTRALGALELLTLLAGLLVRRRYFAPSLSCASR